MAEPSDVIHLPWDAFVANGFVYRFNKLTGDLWRLEVDLDPQNKRMTVWKKIGEAGSNGSAH